MIMIDRVKSLPLPPGDLGLPIIGQDQKFLQDPNIYNQPEQFNPERFNN